MQIGRKYGRNRSNNHTIVDGHQWRGGSEAAGGQPY